VFRIGQLDFHHFDSFLNCFIDFNNILNYLIPWDIGYTQACTSPRTKLRHPNWTLIRVLDIAATMTLSIKWNHPHAKHFEAIQVSHVAQVPPRAIWLQRLLKKVYSTLDGIDWDDICSSDTDKRHTTLASIMQEFHRRLKSLLDNHHTCGLTHRPSCKRLNRGMKLCKA